MTKTNYYEIFQEISNVLVLTQGSVEDFDVHFHKKLEMYYIIDGEFNMTVNGATYVFYPDDIAYVPEFYPHEGENNLLLDCYRLILPHTLTQDIVSLFDGRTLPIAMTDSSYNRLNIKPLLKNMMLQKQQGALDKEIVAKGYLNILIGNLFFHYGTQPLQIPKKTELIVSVLQYIDKNYRKDITLEELSRVFGYNKSYFSRLFNGTVNMNLNQYLNYVRLQKFCAEYSSGTAINITELALSCGFNSISTFYRAFSQIYGTNPAKYLRSSHG